MYFLQPCPNTADSSRDVNNATEYKAKARTFKAKATSISPRPKANPQGQGHSVQGQGYYYCILHTSHHTTILNPIYVCKLFLDIVKSLPPGCVTPRREPTFVFRHGDSAGLGLAVQGQ